MRRIPAPGKMRKEIEELLNGVEEGKFLLSVASISIIEPLNDKGKLHNS